MPPFLGSSSLSIALLLVSLEGPRKIDLGVGIVRLGPFHGHFDFVPGVGGHGPQMALLLSAMQLTTTVFEVLTTSGPACYNSEH
jgi:hypothetical protein